MFAGGAQSGTVVTQVIGIRAVQNPVEPFLAGEVDYGLVDVRLAEVASLRVITAIAGIFRLTALQQLMDNSDLAGEGLSGGKVAPGQAWRDGGDRNGIGSEFLLGQPENERAVDSPGEGYENTLKSPDEGGGLASRMEVLLDGPYATVTWGVRQDVRCHRGGFLLDTEPSSCHFSSHEQGDHGTLSYGASTRTLVRSFSYWSNFCLPDFGTDCVQCTC